MERFDKLWIGILIGLLLPAAFGIGYIETMHLWTALETFDNGERRLEQVAVGQCVP